MVFGDIYLPFHRPLDGGAERREKPEPRTSFSLSLLSSLSLLDVTLRRRVAPSHLTSHISHKPKIHDNANTVKYRSRCFRNRKEKIVGTVTYEVTYSPLHAP